MSDNKHIVNVAMYLNKTKTNLLETEKQNIDTNLLRKQRYWRYNKLNRMTNLFTASQ